MSRTSPAPARSARRNDRVITLRTAHSLPQRKNDLGCGPAGAYDRCVAKKAPTDDVGDRNLRVGPPERTSAGLPGVRAGLAAGLDQMGVRRTARTLLRINQTHGFDCPGCAWPEPGHRSVAEFCENGAKAVAEEATLRRITADFFAEHPIAELAGRSDHWL